MAEVVVKKQLATVGNKICFFARQPFSSFGMHSIRAANHVSSLGSFRKHVLQHLHGVAASCANRHFRERPQKDHTFSRKTTHPARAAPPHSYCTGSTSKTKESVFCKKGPCGLFSPTYFNIFRDLQDIQFLHARAEIKKSTKFRQTSLHLCSFNLTYFHIAIIVRNSPTSMKINSKFSELQHLIFYGKINIP